MYGKCLKGLVNKKCLAIEQIFATQANLIYGSSLKSWRQVTLVKLMHSQTYCFDYLTASALSSVVSPYLV